MQDQRNDGQPSNNLFELHGRECRPVPSKPATPASLRAGGGLLVFCLAERAGFKPSVRTLAHGPETKKATRGGLFGSGAGYLSILIPLRNGGMELFQKKTSV